MSCGNQGCQKLLGFGVSDLLIFGHPFCECWYRFTGARVMFWSVEFPCFFWNHPVDEITCLNSQTSGEPAHVEVNMDRNGGKMWISNAFSFG